MKGGAVELSEQDMQLLRDLGEVTSQELRAVAAATSDDLTGLLAMADENMYAVRRKNRRHEDSTPG